MNNKIISTSHNTKVPRLVHVARINPIRTPEGWEGEIAITYCGKAIRNFYIVDTVSYFYTSGETFMFDCPHCAKYQ